MVLIYYMLACVTPQEDKRLLHPAIRALYSMTITAEDWLCAKVADMNSSLGTHFSPHWKSIQPPDVGVSHPTKQHDEEMFLSLWLHKREDWKQKGFFERKPSDHGGGNQGLCERNSLLSNRKKINIDILTSQQNSSQGFCWIFPWGELKKKRKFKCWYKDTLRHIHTHTHTPC